MKALPLTKPSPRLPPPTKIRSVFCFVSAGGRAGVIFRAHWRVVSTQQTYIRVSRLPTFRAPRTSLALETSSTGPYPRARTVFAVQHLRFFLFSLFRSQIPPASIYCQPPFLAVGISQELFFVLVYVVGVTTNRTRSLRIYICMYAPPSQDARPLHSLLSPALLLPPSLSAWRGSEGPNDSQPVRLAVDGDRPADGLPGDHHRNRSPGNHGDFWYHRWILG